MRIEERRVLGRDDDVGLAEHVERTTAGHAVHRRDHRLPQVVRLGADLGDGQVEGIRFERRVLHSMFATEDQKEGMAAFVEKRKPAFRHRYGQNAV